MVTRSMRLASGLSAAMLMTACANTTGNVSSVEAPCTKAPASGGSFTLSTTELLRRLTSYVPERIDLPRGGSFNTDVGGGPPLSTSVSGLVGIVNYPSDLGSNAIQVTLFDSNVDARAAFMSPRRYDSSADRLPCLPQPTGFQWPVQAFYEQWTELNTLTVERQYRVMVLMNSAVIDATSMTNLRSQASTATSSVLSPQPATPDLRGANAEALARGGLSIIEHVLDLTYVIPDPLPFHRISVKATVTSATAVGKMSALDLKITNIGLPIQNLHISTVADAQARTDNWFGLHNVLHVPSQCQVTALSDEYACGPLTSGASEELLFDGTAKQSGTFLYTPDFTDGVVVNPFVGQTIVLRDQYGGDFYFALSETVVSP